ncbi:MAG: glycosyltransferase [Mycobacteriaceae bacterium]
MTDTLSVVVLAFNEEELIEGCLLSILQQQADIDELIVVDNGSTDTTRDRISTIAAKYPILRLIDEPTHGVVHARNAGFDAAQGHIIARVDADCRISPGWARHVKSFWNPVSRKHIGAVTGPNIPYHSPFTQSKFFALRLLEISGIMKEGKAFEVVHGANMAIRATTWRAIRSRLSERLDIHEDVDLSLCIKKFGQLIAINPAMLVSMSPRRNYVPPLSHTKYIRGGVRTYALHGYTGPLVKFYAAPVYWITHAFLYAAYRPYDQRKGRYSLQFLLTKNQHRIAPITITS